MSEKSDKVSMQNIADALNVSKGLVSIALANKYGVSQDMRAKIVIKAIEMGYVFRKSFKKRVMLLMRFKEDIQEHFWHFIVKGIEIKLSGNNASFSVGEFRDPAKFNDILEFIISKRICGIILVNSTEPVLRHFKPLNIPIVLIDMLQENCFGFDTVMADNFEGGYLAAKYLADMGHTSLAFFGNPLSVSFKERLRGFQACAKNLGLTVYTRDDYENIEIDGIPLDESIGGHILLPREKIEKMLIEREFTAIFCVNDPTAIYIIETAAAIGIRVPEDLSVIGFDNIKKSEKCSPRLTTIDIPKLDMGEMAVNLLISRINGDKSAAKYIKIETKLLERDSVKKLFKQ